jgi:HPt (histidine-containing phosphotransfer) domain-containing protein
MIDRTKLEALLGNDEKMVEKFLNIFKSQTPDQLNLLIKSVAENNWDQASITAHAIKSQCRYLGLEDIAELAFKIEQLTEENNELGLIPGLVAQLELKLMKVLNSYV